MRIILFTLFLVLAGCSGHKPVVVESPQKVYTVETKPADVLPDPGKDREDLIAVVEIPATSPTATPTIVKVYKKPAKIIKKVFRAKDEAVYPVEIVTNNPGVTVSYPEVRPWWHWAILALLLAGIAYFLASKYLGAVSGPIRAIWGFLGRWRK